MRTKGVAFILFINLISRTSCGSGDAFSFVERTDPYVIPGTKPIVSLAYFKLEERMKMCYYAKVKAGLMYLNYNYDPAWMKYESETDPFHQIMDCATLPTVYLRLLTNTKTVDIIFIQSRIDHYVFDTNVIEAVSTSLSSEKDPLATGFGENEVSKLDTESQRNLCVAAVKQISRFYIVDHITKVQTLKFEYADGYEIRNAILCPTLPQLYLQNGKSENEIRLVRLKSFIDNYKFEEDKAKPLSVRKMFEDDPSGRSGVELRENSATRLNPQDRIHLCNIARHYHTSSHVPYVQDTDSPEALLYKFQYPDELIIRDVAFFCPAFPSMYLRVNDSLEDSKITLTFVRTPADEKVYHVEVVRYFYPRFAGETQKAELSDTERKKPHPFTLLNDEDRWNLCYTAPKHLLDEPEAGNRWIFRFTQKEHILSTFKLLVIPRYVKGPEMMEITLLNNTTVYGLVITCSEWPEMDLRLGESDEQIIIMLHKREVVLNDAAKQTKNVSLN